MSGRCDGVAEGYVSLDLGPISRSVGWDYPVARVAIFNSISVVMLGLPQLALALVGGFVARRFGRRPERLIGLPTRRSRLSPKSRPAGWPPRFVLLSNSNPPARSIPGLY
jgi:hypothetical protein